MPDPAELQSSYEAKARLELQTADGLLPGSEAVRWSGNVFARVALVKGAAGEEDLRSGSALAGPDGEAARKALAALGFEPESTFATISRLGDDPAAAVERLALQLEAVDPALVVALDPEAASDVARVAGLQGLAAGEPAGWNGRTLVALSGLEASLHDDALKQRVWSEFKAASEATTAP